VELPVHGARPLDLDLAGGGGEEVVLQHPHLQGRRLAVRNPRRGRCQSKRAPRPPTPRFFLRDASTAHSRDAAARQGAGDARDHNPHGARAGFLLCSPPIDLTDGRTGYSFLSLDVQTDRPPDEWIG
jgi:hypothetical protein